MTGPSVVIIVEQNKTAPNTMPTFFGKVVMSNGKTFCQKIEYWKKIAPRPFIAPKPYRHGPDTYYCNLLRVKLKTFNEPPLYIAMSQNDFCDNLLPPMPVFYDNRRKREKFAVCIQKGIFGIPAETLISFVELNKALGASFITIWIQNIEESVYNAMIPYVESGLVEMLDWKVTTPIRNYGTHAACNECVYRNIHRAEYVALHDIDEVFIPYKHDDWFGMLDDLGKITKITDYAGFRFESLPWCDKGNHSTIKLKCNSTFLPYYFKNTYRLKGFDRHRPKMMLSMDRAIAGHNHIIPYYKKGIKQCFHVPHNIGMSHHYRVTPVDGEYVLNNTMERFVDKIIPSLEKHLMCKQ